MLKLAEFESSIRAKFADKIDQQASIFAEDKKTCLKYAKMLHSMSSNDDITNSEKMLQWTQKQLESVEQLNIDDFAKAKKMEKALVSMIQSVKLEAPILVTCQALIKSFAELYDNSSVQRDLMVNFDQKITSYWLVSESDKLLSRELHELIKSDSDNVRLMTFFFTKSTNCLKQCQSVFGFKAHLMASLKLFLADQTSSFLAVIPVRIYELIRTLDAPSELDNCIDVLVEKEKRYAMRRLIYKCGYLAQSLLFLRIKGIDTMEILMIGLRKEIYVDIQSTFDRFEVGHSFVHQIHTLDEELGTIKRNFNLIIRQINIDGNALFDVVLVDYIKWCVEVMDCDDNVLTNILEFPQNKPSWPLQFIEQLTANVSDGDMSKFGLVCKENG